MSAAPAHDYLPSPLDEIAEVAGLPAALAIAEAHGGTRLYFPARAPAGHWLERLVGRAAADSLCAHFRSTAKGGIHVDIPLGPKSFYRRARRRALEMLAEGKSGFEVARRIGIHARSVRRYRARALRSDDQGNLF